MNESEPTGLAGVRPVDDPLWSAHVDQIGDALDTITQILSTNESAARREAARLSNSAAQYEFPSIMRESFASAAANHRGKADAYMVAHKALLVAFQPILAQVFVTDVADVLDEDHCEASE